MAETNLIKKADLAKAREIDFTYRFGESVKKLMELDVKNIYPGHGPIVENNGKDHIRLSYSYL